MVDCEFV